MFDGVPDTRFVVNRDAQLEIVLICFADGQTSSVHDHHGSNYVIQRLGGRILEALFERASDTTLAAFTGP